MKVIAFIILTLILLTACSAPVTPTDDSGNNNNPTGTVSEDANRYLLPSANLEGFELKIYYRGSETGNGSWAAIDVVVEEQTGDLINDAVYSRNQIIEEKYNCKIIGISSAPDQLSAVRASILANDSSFDVIVAMTGSCATLSQEGLLIDLFDLDYLNLEQSWWDINATRDLSIDNKLYFTTGDLSISCWDAIQTPVFNKTVLNEHNVDDPYEIVRSGDWTIDKMKELCVGINTDINGDGIMNDKDKWGYLAYPWGGLFLFYGADEKIVTKDENDLPELSVFNDRAASVVDKIFTIHAQNAEDVIIGWSGVQTAMMSEDRVLMTITSLFGVRKMFRESVNSDFGILPIPKFDEKQQKYRNLVVFQDTANLYAVPITCENRENTGFVLEALAQESTMTLREAYYDKVISYKALRDEDSLEMLEIIFSNRVYDLAQMYNWGGWNDYFTGISNKSSNDFASHYASIEEATIAAIQETIDIFKEN